MKNVAVVLILAGIITGCATTATKEVDKKVAGEQVTMAPGEVANKGYDAIMKSPNLSTEQKQKIVGIMGRVQADSVALKEESNKLKIALFKTLGEQGYKADQVSVIKKRLQKIQDKKMNLMFSSLEEVQKVMGVVPDSEKQDMHEIYRAMGGTSEL